MGDEEYGRNRYRKEKKPRNNDREVDQKLERLKEQLLVELRARDSASLMLPTSSPFIRRIQLETILKKFMMPMLAAYDKTRNLRDHVLNYKIFMELQMRSNALLCKAFPTTLIGSAQTWFNSLELGSVKIFFDLDNLFIGRLIANILLEER